MVTIMKRSLNKIVLLSALSFTLLGCSRHDYFNEPSYLNQDHYHSPEIISAYLGIEKEVIGNGCISFNNKRDKDAYITEKVKDENIKAFFIDDAAIYEDYNLILTPELTCNSDLYYYEFEKINVVDKELHIFLLLKNKRQEPGQAIGEKRYELCKVYVNKQVKYNTVSYSVEERITKY